MKRVQIGKIDKALNEGDAIEYVTKSFTADKMHKTIGRYFYKDGNINGEVEEESFFKGILKS